jgi:hypothetical protein
MAKLKNLLRNRNVILLSALAGGLFFPFAVPVTRHFILPALALTMSISTMEVDNKVFRSPRVILFPALLGIVMNYILLCDDMEVYPCSPVGRCPGRFGDTTDSRVYRRHC